MKMKLFAVVVFKEEEEVVSGLQYNGGRNDDIHSACHPNLLLCNVM